MWLGFYPVLLVLQGEAVSGRKTKCTLPYHCGSESCLALDITRLGEDFPMLQEGQREGFALRDSDTMTILYEKNHRITEYQIGRDLRDHLIQHHVHKELSYFLVKSFNFFPLILSMIRIHDKHSYPLVPKEEKWQDNLGDLCPICEFWFSDFLNLLYYEYAEHSCVTENQRAMADLCCISPWPGTAEDC